MARITVEDCIVHVPNRFELVVLAARRVQQLFSGAAPTVKEDHDKAPVIALREIAVHHETGKLSLDDLKESLVRSMRTHVDMDEPEEETVDFMSDEALLADSEEEASQEG